MDPLTNIAESGCPFLPDGS